MNFEKAEESINNPSITISEIKFNNGITIPLNSDDIVVFVGANNVGKSRALKDIKDDLIEPTRNKVIIDEIKYNTSNFNNESMKRFFDNNFAKDSYGNYNVPVEFEHTWSYGQHNFKNILSEKEYFYKALFTFLSTENRLNITSPISYMNVRERYNLKVMEKLEADADAITKLNKILLACFGKAVDISEEYLSNSVAKLYKFGTEEEINETINSSTRDARQKLKKLEGLHDQGDGIRSAVAILSSLIVNEHSLYLIDEPETFLHPPQARLLGNNIVELSKNKQCFISTHNIDLIRGILEKNSSRIKIIKIDRFNNDNDFHVLDNESIKQIANDRNLKYSNILNGLFYTRVVLCENESDCKFYSAILESLDSSIYQNTLFCAVGGKDQFKIIIPLLKNLRINFLVIADIDLINNKDKLKQLLNVVKHDEYNKISVAHKEFLDKFEENTDTLVKKQTTIRAEIEKVFTEDEYMTQEATDKIKSILKNINSLKLLKEGGKAIIPQGECVLRFNEIVNLLNQNNIFVLECGEIERFIPEIDMHGSGWVEEVFKKYTDIDDEIYDKAKAFIKKVFKISNSSKNI